MKHILSIAICLLSLRTLAQHVTQTVRGTIRDEVAQSPIIGASVLVMQPGGTPPLGATTDVNGAFSIAGVPMGRQTLRITSVGYEQQRLPNVIVTAGKEVVLVITMTETVQSLNEVVVLADRKNDKSKTNNELSLVSGRSFNSDETKRYAGALGDPSRMAANYAGVVAGNDSRNDIVVRGNSPTGMLWQLEGLNIPNPNHFGSLSSTGGPVSMLNNNVLDKSDFLTGAFPAQYGNALSGVFDLRLREGNNQKQEFLGQIGFNGFEVGAEGPLTRYPTENPHRASYLINYRYSTLGLFKTLGISFGAGNAVPDYQDLTFKVFIPIGPKSNLAIFGTGGRSDVAFLGNDVDTTKTNLYGTENENTRVNYSTTIAGLSYQYALTPKTFAKLTLGISTTHQAFNGDSISTVTRAAFASGEARYSTRKYSAVLNVRHKVNAKSSLYGGITADLLNVDLYNRHIYQGGRYDSVRVNTKGENTMLTQAYGQWRYRFSPNFLLTTGLHVQHYSLNNTMALEPRTGLRYSFPNGQSLSLGYGLHSQAQPIYTYFVQTPAADGVRYTNKALGFTRSHHLVLSYENRLGENMLLKIEPYYQSLNNVPVERRRSSFSSLNTGNSFGPSDVDSLVNEGTGRNIGVELTLERYFNQGYYFLVTTSLFDSNYKGSDGIERNTAFNTGYVVNVLAGREIKVGRHRNNVFSASIRASSVGGHYVSPLDLDASRQRGEAIYNERLAYSEHQNPYFRADLRLAYRKEMRKRTLEIAVDLQNVTGRQNIFQQTYNRRTNNLANQYQQGFFPVPQVRYTF